MAVNGNRTDQLKRYGPALALGCVALLMLILIMQSDAPQGDMDPADSGDSGLLDNDYSPIVKIPPMFPEEAKASGLEGHCDLEFTVTAGGKTADISVIECTNALFEQPSIEALRKFRYKPRMVDGEPVSVSGARNRFSFIFST